MRQSCLGTHCLLGTNILNAHHKIAIHLETDSFENAYGYFPHQEKGLEMIRIIQTYLGIVIEFEVIFTLPIRDNISLGQCNQTLGWQSLVGETTQKTTTIRFIP